MLHPTHERGAEPRATPREGANLVNTLPRESLRDGWLDAALLSVAEKEFWKCAFGSALAHRQLGLLMCMSVTVSLIRRKYKVLADAAEREDDERVFL